MKHWAQYKGRKIGPFDSADAACDAARAKWTPRNKHKAKRERFMLGTGNMGPDFGITFPPFVKQEANDSAAVSAYVAEGLGEI